MVVVLLRISRVQRNIKGPIHNIMPQYPFFIENVRQIFLLEAQVDFLSIEPPSPDVVEGELDGEHGASEGPLV